MANSLNYAPEPKMATKQTAFTAARDTFQQIEKLADRIDSVVNQLVGAQPVPDSCGESPAPNGVFDSLQRGATEASNAVMRAHSALDRLDRSI